MSKLDEAVQKILADRQYDPWTELCVATIRLGAAFAEFDNARKAYIKSQKDKENNDATRASQG